MDGIVMVPAGQMDKDKAGAIADACAALALAMGADTVVVMVSGDQGDKHSAYAAKYWGRCIQVRGLLETGADTVRQSIVYDKT